MKRIIVCCDGTWNADDTQTNDTNVAILARAIPRCERILTVLQLIPNLSNCDSLTIHKSVLL